MAVEELAEAISEMDEEMVIIPPLFLGPRHDLALSILERSSGRSSGGGHPCPIPGEGCRRAWSVVPSTPAAVYWGTGSDRIAGPGT